MTTRVVVGQERHVLRDRRYSARVSAEEAVAMGVPLLVTEVGVGVGAAKQRWGNGNDFVFVDGHVGPVVVGAGATLDESAFFEDRAYDESAFFDEPTAQDAAGKQCE